MSDPLYLSQSMLKEFESMCHYAFKHRWYGTDAERKLFDIDKEVFARGVLFETLAIGCGLGGKTAKDGDVKKSSVYYDRIVRQANVYRQWERANGFKPIQSQLYVKERIEWDGGVYFAQGNLDRLVRDSNGRILIDTKLTGDKDNTFGKFQFGNPDKVDVTQILHYKILAETRFNEPVRAMYYVADSSPSMGVKVLEYSFSDWEIQMHHERCQTAYNEIMQAKIGDWFEPSPSYDNCSNCPMADQCKYRIKIPEIQLIER